MLFRDTVKPIALALWCWAVEIVSPTSLVVPLALLGSAWDRTDSLDSNGAFACHRGDLPAWAHWYQTPDERLPGGTYEPTVLSVYKTFGKWVTSFYWLVLRNRLQGLAWRFRRPMVTPWELRDGLQVQETPQGLLWFRRRPVGPWVAKTGWRQYVVDGTPWAVPCLTITKP